MNPAINIELKFFLISILWGILLLAAYDILRILRRIIKHDEFFIALEDLIFWVVASLFIFAMIYQENDGIIRGFCIMGMFLGAVLYHYAFSDLLINLITKVIRILLSPITMVLRRFKQFLQFLWSKLKRTGNNQYLRLKKEIKSVRIAVENKKKKKAPKKEAPGKEASKKKTSKKEASKKVSKRNPARKKQKQ